jgi:hypothetical protein
MERKDVLGAGLQSGVAATTHGNPDLAGSGTCKWVYPTAYFISH